MLQATQYSAVELLPDGRRVEIRALKPGDEAEFVAAVDRVSAQSLYRRFFGVKRSFSDAEKAFFLNVDFVNHVALVAVVENGKRALIVGGGRYVVVQPGTAEVAFVVTDEFQGQGIGTRLMRHLVALARAAGLKTLIAEVLSENAAMLKVFENSGLGLSTRRDGVVVHVAMQI